MTDRSFCTVGLGGSPPKFTAAAPSLLVSECVRLTNRPSIRIEPCFHPSHFANRPTKANAELVEVTDFSLAPLPRFHQLLDSISLLFGGGIQRKSGRATPVMTSSFENA